MDDKARLQRAAKLFEASEDFLGKLADIHRELGEILKNGTPIGDKIKRLENTFNDAWQDRYGTPYVWNWQRDRQQMKRLLKVTDEATIAARMLVYVYDSSDPFITKNRHPFTFFVNRFNTFAVDAVGLFSCSHVPTCKDDAEHTQKELGALRRLS